MPIMSMVSATKTLDKVLCLGADIKHSTFENGAYHICNDTIEHVREDEKGKKITYQPVPFFFSIPNQTSTDDAQIQITNVGLVCSDILKSADNSIEDIIVQCWLIIANYDGTGTWQDMGEYILSTNQTETVESVVASLKMNNCYGINVGRFRGSNPDYFINLNHR